MANRIGDGVELAVEVNFGAGVEFLEVQGRIIEKLLGLRVSGDKDLEAAVEEEAVDGVGTDPSADAVGGFEEEEGDTGGIELCGGGESREAAANDDGSFGVFEGGGSCSGGSCGGCLCGGSRYVEERDTAAEAVVVRVGRWWLAEEMERE